MSSVPSASQRPDMFSLARAPKNTLHIFLFALSALAFEFLSGRTDHYLKPALTSLVLNKLGANNFEALILVPNLSNLASGIILLVMATALLWLQQKRQFNRWIVFDRLFGIHLAIGILLGFLVIAVGVIALTMFKTHWGPGVSNDPFSHVLQWLECLSIFNSVLDTASFSILFLGWLLPSLARSIGEERAIWITAITCSLPFIYMPSSLGLVVSLSSAIETLFFCAVLCTISTITRTTSLASGLCLTWRLGSYVAVMRSGISTLGDTDIGSQTAHFVVIWNGAAIVSSLFLLWILRRKHLFGLTWAPEEAPMLLQV